jgi:intraflagellar transport protein 56
MDIYDELMKRDNYNQ